MKHVVGYEVSIPSPVVVDGRTNRYILDEGGADSLQESLQRVHDALPPGAHIHDHEPLGEDRVALGFACSPSQGFPSAHETALEVFGRLAER